MEWQRRSAASAPISLVLMATSNERPTIRHAAASLGAQEERTTERPVLWHGPCSPLLAATARRCAMPASSKPIEDYGLIGNMISAALVARDGSIDWLCLPHFDSAACFAALLGGPEHGRWLLAPADERARSSRRYLSDTAILETLFETAGGAVTVTD